MNLVEFRTENSPVFVNPEDVVSVAETIAGWAPGVDTVIATGIWLRGQSKPLLVYGDTPGEVVKKLAETSSAISEDDKRGIAETVAKLRTDADRLDYEDATNFKSTTLREIAEAIEKKFLK